MDGKDELLKKLLATFMVEAAENCRALSCGLVELEKDQSSQKRSEVLETIYREAHSLKGAARAVSLTEIEAACGALEDIFAGFKKSEIEPYPRLFDSLHQIVDAIGEYIGTPPDERTMHLSRLLKDLTHLRGGGEPPFSEDRPVEAGRPSDPLPIPENTVRIPTARLDSLLIQSEEMLSAKLAAKRRASALMETLEKLDSWTKEWAKVQPEVRKVGRISDQSGETVARQRNGLKPAVGKLVDFLEWNRTFMATFRENLEEMAKAAETDTRLLNRMVEHLLEDMKQVLMLPFSSLLEGFPKMVRDLARDAGKEIDLVLQGCDVEIDKRILDEMKIPLTHLLRNCVDHGAEKSEVRRSLGKPGRGRIGISISQLDSSKVEVLVSDDGTGIDPKKVRAAYEETIAASTGETSNAAAVSLLSMICRSGVSTSPMITDISGHGLGLAIVQEKLETLGGSLSLETKPNVGTKFRILLPLTLSVFRGVLVQSGGRDYIVQVANVERVLRLGRDQVRSVENRDTVELNGDVLSLVILEDVLGLPHAQGVDRDSDYLTVMVLTAAGKRIAFAVDGVLNEQEVLTKSLGKQLRCVHNIAGAMVQSSGQVVPVLNVVDLLQSAVDTAGTKTAVTQAGEPEPEVGISVLVVEDSITSRTLLKNILEASGYHVTTAVDGVDAMTTLMTNDFDLVVSDVDMPRMDGFELTTAIRSHEKLSGLPLVLVTSLESRADRERGIDVGANAYIAKSSFDQINLLETIERFV